MSRLVADLKRPMGGWTVGFLTLGAVLAGPLVGTVGPDWIVLPWMLAFLFVHVVWGSAGYYPRRI